jgi:hypothetical protein
LDTAVGNVKTVEVFVADALATSKSAFDAVADVAALAKDIGCVVLLVDIPLTPEDRGVGLEMASDVDSGAARAVSGIDLLGLFEAITLSLSAVPFHNTLHELVLKLLGT